MKLALFDFDGTLVKGDSFIHFLRFHFGDWSVAMLGLKIPFHLIVQNRSFNRDAFKEFIVDSLFKNQSEKDLLESGEKFIEQKILNALRPEVFSDFQKYIDDPEWRVVVVSASLSIWLKAFVRRYDAELICSGLEFKDGICSGKLLGRNCNYDQKRIQILNSINLSTYSEIVVFGNSKGDDAMFSLGTSIHKV